ncbi:hypothetical protein CMV_011451, partial [Castanea mollissima]
NKIVIFFSIEAACCFFSDLLGYRPAADRHRRRVGLFSGWAGAGSGWTPLLLCTLCSLTLLSCRCSFSAVLPSLSCSLSLELSLLFLGGASQSLVLYLDGACCFLSYQLYLFSNEDKRIVTSSWVWKAEGNGGWTKQVVEAGAAGDNSIETKLVCDSPTSSSFLVAIDIDFNG